MLRCGGAAPRRCCSAPAPAPAARFVPLLILTLILAYPHRYSTPLLLSSASLISPSPHFSPPLLPPTSAGSALRFLFSRLPSPSVPRKPPRALQPMLVCCQQPHLSRPSSPPSTSRCALQHSPSPAQPGSPPATPPARLPTPPFSGALRRSPIGASLRLLPPVRSPNGPRDSPRGSRQRARKPTWQPRDIRGQPPRHALRPHGPPCARRRPAPSAGIACACTGACTGATAAFGTGCRKWTTGAGPARCAPRAHARRREPACRGVRPHCVRRAGSRR